MASAAELLQRHRELHEAWASCADEAHVREHAAVVSALAALEVDHGEVDALDRESSERRSVEQGLALLGVEAADGCVADKIRKLIKEGKPRAQAVAIAMQMCGQAREAATPAMAAELTRASEAASGERVGVFVRLPSSLASLWPIGLRGDDRSAPHVTLLYVGAVARESFDLVERAVRDAVAWVAPFRCVVETYGEFGTPTGELVAAMIPDAPQLAEIAAVVKHGLERSNVKMVEQHAPFRPHATLAVLHGDAEYDGPRPAGEFVVESVEVWGLDREVVIKLGERLRAPESTKALESVTVNQGAADVEVIPAGVTETELIPEGVSS